MNTLLSLDNSPPHFCYFKTKRTAPVTDPATDPVTDPITDLITDLRTEMATEMSTLTWYEDSTGTESAVVQSGEQCRDLATGELHSVGDTWSNPGHCWQHSCSSLGGSLYYTTTLCPSFYIPPHWTNCSQVAVRPSLAFPDCCPRPSCQTSPRA